MVSVSKVKFKHVDAFLPEKRKRKLSQASSNLGNRQPCLARLALSILCLGLFGCDFIREARTTREAETIEEAGTVSASVVAVARFEEYVDQLQPVFKLTPEEALERVQQPTRVLQESFLSAVRAGIALNLPKSTQTATQTSSVGNTSTTAGSDTTSSSTNSANTTQSSQRGPLTDSAPDSPGALPTGLRAPALVDAPAMPLDPMLHYLSATALYQEVKLLSTYMSQAIKAKDYAPYIVRVQVSVMPHGNLRPYDTFLDLSLDSSAQGMSLDAAVTGECKGRKRGFSGTEWERSPQLQFKNAEKRRVVVVPLLVTDNLESTVHSQMNNQLVQFAMTVKALNSNVGAGLGIDNTSEKLRRSLGRDLNSLMTVGKVNDNTVQVRLGALSTTSAREMIPRTHNVTLLMLVPREKSREMTLMGKYQFRDFRTGTPLTSANKVGSVKSLELSKRLENSWFEVPPLRVAQLQVVSQKQFALLDDGKESTLQIDGGTELTTADFGISLVVNETAKNSDGTALPANVASFAPTTVKVDASRRMLMANFHSLLQLGYKQPSVMLNIDAVQGAVLNSDAHCVESAAIPATHLSFTKEPQPIFKVSSPLPLVWTDRERSGTFTVFADFDPAKLKTLHYRLLGADVVSVACQPACPTSRQIIAPGVIEFTVRNLSNRVTLRAGADANKLGETGVDLMVVNKDRLDNPTK